MKGLLTQKQLEMKYKLIRDFMIDQPKLTISEYYSCDLNKVDDPEMEKPSDVYIETSDFKKYTP